jgi:pimeloyl-ACP methyl ester carboxylesterase
MKLRPNRNYVLAKNDFKKMIITGRKDPVLDIQKSIEEAEKTNSKLIIFPDGHMSHIENFAKLIVVLRNFIRDC